MLWQGTDGCEGAALLVMGGRWSEGGTRSGDGGVRDRQGGVRAAIVLPAPGAAAGSTRGSDGGVRVVVLGWACGGGVRAAGGREGRQ